MGVGGGGLIIGPQKCLKTSYIAVLIKILFEFDRLFYASKRRKKLNSF